MPRTSNKDMPSVLWGTLYTNDDDNGIRLDSPQWFAWLNRVDRFYFQSQQGTFTAKRETRRNGVFWYAFKTVDSKTRKVYLGKSESLTGERLANAATQIS